MSTHTDPGRRESPVVTHTVKTHTDEHRRRATTEKTAGRDPRQEIARQPRERDSTDTRRSHKSIFRPNGSPDRMDSRAEIYSLLAAWPGQTHE